MFRARISIEVTNQAGDDHTAVRAVRFLPSLLVALALAAVPAMASAEIGWHRDYATARAASSASGKPVFALFVATWDDEPSADVFANAEVEAVIAACFEPVRVDVDKEANLIRELAIERVPSVAVIAARGDSVTRFDCPKTPAEFVATAARAAQVSAASATPRADAAASNAFASSPFGGSLEGGPAGVDSSVANKVRQLSSFAEGKAASVRDDNRFQGAQQPAHVSAPQVPAPPAYAHTQSGFSQQTYQQQPYPQPGYGQAASVPAAPVDASLPRTPPTTWSPEQPAPSAYAQFQPGAQPTTAGPASPYPMTPPRGVNPQTPVPVPSIEPAAAASSPWLARTPAPPSDAEPEASATASDDGVEKKTAPTGFMAGVQKAVNPMNWWSAKPTVSPPPKMPPALPQPPAALAAKPSVVPPATAARTPAADPYASMPVALDSCCPVTVVERGAWVEGRAQWGVRHRGRTYLFAGPEQQQTFLANPDRYAPALSGDDPVLAFEAGRSEPGQRSYGVVYQSRMYLFASPQNRDAFSADPARYATRVQLAEGLPPSDASRRF